MTNRKADLETIGRDIAKLAKITPPFPRITYDDAVKLLQEGHAKGQVEAKFEWGGDFGSPDETYISSQFEKPVMVHRYPAKVKAFYMEPDPQRPDLALCVDVLAPEGYGEIIGGSQRIGDYELAAASAFMIMICRKKPSSGIWICASLAACRMPGLAWALSAPWPGYADWSTCVKQFHLRVL